MIQRKQSLYLLVVAVMMALMMFMPLAKLSPIQGVDDVVFDAWGIHFSVGDGVPLIYFGVIIGLASILALAIVLLFKRRKLQLRLSYALLVLVGGVFIYEMIYSSKLYSVEGYVVDFSPMMLLPIFCLPLVYLAIKGIIHDISLVKSYDRVR